MTGNELLDIVLPRLAKFPDTSGVSILDAINRSIEIFFDRLHRRKSDIIRANFDDVENTPPAEDGVVIDGEFNTLPSDFRGFAGPVRLIDSDDVIYDLTEMEYGQETLEDSYPLYWRLAGPFNLQVIPAAEEDYNLKGFYYSMPDTLSDLDDDLPWEGLFDSRIADAVVLIVSIGGVEAVGTNVRESIGDICERVISNRTYHPRNNKLWL